MSSGNKLQTQKKGPWNLGEKERQGKPMEVEEGLGVRGEYGEDVGVLHRVRTAGSSMLREFIWRSQRRRIPL